MRPKQKLFLLILVVGVFIAGVGLRFFRHNDSGLNQAETTTADQTIAVNQVEISIFIQGERLFLEDELQTKFSIPPQETSLFSLLSEYQITMKDACLQLGSEKEYCPDETNILTTQINGSEVASPSAYILKNQDRVLIYYGIDDFEIINLLTE